MCSFQANLLQLRFIIELTISRAFTTAHDVEIVIMSRPVEKKIVFSFLLSVDDMAKTTFKRQTVLTVFDSSIFFLCDGVAVGTTRDGGFLANAQWWLLN